MDKIYALQLVNYFLNNGYAQVTVFTNEKIKRAGYEYWLFSSTNKHYTAIHISDEDMSARNANRLLKIETMKKFKELANSDGSLLDITLNLEAIDETLDGFTYFAYRQVGVFPEYITSIFNSLNKYCYEVKDEKEAEKMVRKQIRKTNLASSHKSSLRESLKNTTLMYKIVSIICLVIWAAITAISYKTQISSTSVAICFGAYYKSFITLLSDYWRLLTYGFVHIDVFHILCNLMAFKSLSKSCENIYGATKSWIILLVSIIIGGLFVYIGQGNIVVVGLSGGIYGLLGAVAIEYIAAGALKDKRFVSSLLKDLYMNVVITILFPTAWLAHVGGFVAGLFLGFVLNKESFNGLKTHFSICGIVLLLVLGYMGYNKRNFTDYYYGTDLEVASLYSSVGLNGYSERIVVDTFDYYTGD